MSIPELVIREIRARPVVAPLPRPIRTASGDVLDAPLLLIDVLTDVGLTGRAYGFAYTLLTLRSLAQFLRDIAPELIGKSVSRRARMRQTEKRLKLVGWQGFAGMVVGTLDMALWDALARAMDVPLAVLLGGERPPLPAYDSFGCSITEPTCPGWRRPSRAASRRSRSSSAQETSKATWPSSLMCGGRSATVCG